MPKLKNKPLTPEEQRKKEMIESILQLTQKVEHEQKFKNQFELEKLKFHECWVKAKTTLDDRKFDILSKEREIQEVQKRNQIILQNHRDQVKHFLFVKQNEHIENRFQIEKNLKYLEEDEHALENQLNLEIRGLRQELKVQENSQNNFMINLKFSSQFILTKIRNEFERESNEMKTKYDLKMQKIRQDMEDYSNTVIKELEERKQQKINVITKMNNKKYKEIKNYYNDITASNLQMIKHLKSEIDQAQQSEEKDKKQLLKAEDTFRKLTEPIKSITEEIQSLKTDKE